MKVPVAKMISQPSGAGFYTETNDRMPAFAGHAGAAGRLLTDDDIALLARYLRGEVLTPGAPAEADAGAAGGAAEEESP